MKSNTTLYITFGLAKLSGILGITVALMGHRTIGAVLFGVAFVLLACITMVCVRRLKQVPDDWELYDKNGRLING